MPLKNELTNNADQLMITAKELWRSAYIAIISLLALGLIMIVCQHYLNQQLAKQLNIITLIITLALAAAIIVSLNIRTIRLASSRHQFKLTQSNDNKDNANLQTESVSLIIESHILLDEAIQIQLNGVVNEAENAAMMLIARARKISYEANALMSHFDNHNIYEGQISRQQHNDLYGAVKNYNLRLTEEITEILGQIQFQDVVRQRVERAEIAVRQRNALFVELSDQGQRSLPYLLALSVKMRAVLDAYLLNESHHAASFNKESEHDANIVKIELF